MAINIKVGEPENTPEAIKIKVGEQKDAAPQASIMLNARKTLSGDVMIFDHKDIDIVLMPGKKKIVAFAKDILGDHVYEAQNRLFRFLLKRGIIEYNSVQGGNMFSSMEAKIQESTMYNEVQHTLLAVSRFLEKERPLMEFERAFDRQEEDRLNEPPPGEYTEFDPGKYHHERKGSINTGQMPYGMSTATVYRLEE